MKALIKILSYVTYGSKAINAIIEGFQVVIANWPTDNPFNSADKKLGEMVRGGEQQPNEQNERSEPRNNQE